MDADVANAIPFEAVLPLLALGAWALTEYVPGINGVGKPIFMAALASVVALVLSLVWPELGYKEISGAVLGVLGGSYVNSVVKTNAVTAALKRPTALLLLVALIGLGGCMTRMDTTFVDQDGTNYRQTVRAGFGAKVADSAGRMNYKWTKDGGTIAVGQDAAGIDQRAQAESFIRFLAAVETLAPLLTPAAAAAAP